MCLESYYRYAYEDFEAAGKSQEPDRANGNQIRLVLGGQAYVRTDFKLGFNTPLTVESIVTPTAAQPDGTVIGNFDNNGFGMRAFGSKWDFLWHNKGRYINANSGIEVVPGRRVHLAGVAEGNRLAIYVDGRICGTANLNGHRTSNHPLFVGADPGPRNSPQHFFEGIFESVRVSDTARYGRNFRPPANLESDANTLLLFDFTERQGTTVKDRSGNGHDGTIFGGKWIKLR